MEYSRLYDAAGAALPRQNGFAAPRPQCAEARQPLLNKGLDVILKSGYRFSLGTNAKRLPGDHAQTKR